MHGGRFWIAMLGAMLWAAGALAAPIPPALEEWREWVLRGHEEALCPPSSDDENLRHCAWPGELRIEADARGARFTQRWTAYARQSLPLPGDEDLRPLDVTLDGQPVPVGFADGAAVIDVPAGSHTIAGRLEWDARPPTLPLSETIAWVSLGLDGETVAVPTRDESGHLVLGATDAAEGDALQLEVYRLLADGTPPWLATRVVLSVTGKPREQVIGPLLPPGFVPVALDGQVPLRWEPDGRLRLQLRPGDWSITVIARAPAAATEFAMPTVPEPWVPQEIWQLRVAPEFRVAQFEGVPGVDPDQADVPSWSDGVGEEMQARWGWLLASTALPTYVLDPDARATLVASLRGLPTERPPRLTLARELWLSFDGSEYLARDRLGGQAGSAQRFDLRAPWKLEEATSGEGLNLLVTQGLQDGESGFEWRDPDVRVDTGARAPRSASLPANGWTHAFDQASTTLHLPPGYRLFGATGVDAASGSWVANWSLLDLFLASMVLLLAWRLRHPAIAVALLGWVVFAWHEQYAPRLTLLFAIGLVLALRYVPAGRWQRGIALAQRAVFALAVFWALSFAALQLKWAIFPQLEDWAGPAGSVEMVEASFNEPQMAMAPPPPPPAPMSRAQPVEESAESLDAIEVTGSRVQSNAPRMKKMDLYKYPTDAIPQAGRARPAWQWHTHYLSWNGPLLSEETMRLWISPPWLTRLLRVASVLLLGYALFALARRAGRLPPALPRGAQPELPLAAAAMLALALALPGAVRAQATPDPALLEELRTRLLAGDGACDVECASLATVEVQRVGDGVRLALEAHAATRLAYPLPWPAEAPVLAGLRVDGVAAQPRQDNGAAFVVLERGVHRIEIEFAGGDGRWRLAFPLAPARVRVAEDGLEHSGIDEGRLIGDTLELIAAQAARDDGSTAADAGEAIPPFVRVRRHVTIDQQWRVDTTVERIAPLRGGLTVPVKLLAGELPIVDAPPVREGIAQVSIPAGQDSVSWSSRLTPGNEYALVATDARGYSEEWLIDAAPLLHVEPAGIPESASQNEGTRRYLPLPGESLKLVVTRPAAVQGATLSIAQVTLAVTPGQRARDATLTLQLRSTRAGQHWLPLPEGSELLRVSIDGVDQPRVLDAGRVGIALRSQPQTVAVTWREPIAIGFASRTPALELGADAGNLTVTTTVPADRWLLAASGPGLGPALLYWPQLALLVIVAWGLARWKLAPLKFHQWLLLGLGFSTVSWIAAAIVAGWLLLMGWRARLVTPPANQGFSFLQAGLVFATFVALACLVANVPAGLLGTPDMQVAGAGSHASQLQWFLDGTPGTLPAATAWTLPLWVYKVAILAWALWLANALIGWLRWAWLAWSTGGRWYSGTRKG